VVGDLLPVHEVQRRGRAITGKDAEPSVLHHQQFTGGVTGGAGRSRATGVILNGAVKSDGHT